VKRTNLSSGTCLLLLCFLIVLVWSSPLWLTGGKIGIYDWGFYTPRFEVLRRTILEYRQWLGNNPWNMGGQPLLGHPGVGLFSIKSVLVLLFGSVWGLEVAALVYLIIGLWGAWKLSGLWWSDRFVRVIFSLYIVANPAMTYHTSIGHINFQTFYFFPLMLYYLLNFKLDKWSGPKAAVVAGLAINDSPAYMAQYALLTLAGVFIWLCIKNYKQHIRSLINWALLFLSVLLAVSFYRIITILEIAFDFPRILNYRVHYEIKILLKAYFIPYTAMCRIYPHKYCRFEGFYSSWEICCYIGIIAFLLAVLSLYKGFKWWHTAIIVFVWAWIGNDSYFHIMYWLQKIPTFSSHLGFSRIRVFALFFFGIAATSGLDYLRARCSDYRLSVFRYGVVVIGILMAVEPLAVSYNIMKNSHIVFPAGVKFDYKSKFQNTRSLPNWIRLPPQIYPSYKAMQMNLGWLDNFGDSYLPGETIRLGRNERGYIGEFVQNALPVEPVYWSPNKIIFEGLDPNKPLILNMNPGNPWYCNGVQLFPKYRIVEQQKPFEVMPNKSGVVELTYIHPGQKTGLIGTLIFLVISAFVGKWQLEVKK
jgi:hypothetical protein